MKIFYRAIFFLLSFQSPLIGTVACPNAEYTPVSASNEANFPLPFNDLVARLEQILAKNSGYLPSEYIKAENHAAEYFNNAREYTPTLIQFLVNMPKGGSLHNHLAGSIYTEDFLKLAEQFQLYVDPKTLVFSKEKGDGSLTVAQLKNNHKLLGQFFKFTGTRGTGKCLQGGHDHFFNTFFSFKSIIGNIPYPELLLIAIRSDIIQNIQYEELMTSLISPPFPEDIEQQFSMDNLSAYWEKIQPWVNNSVMMTRELFHQIDDTVAQKFKLSKPFPICPPLVAIRYLISSSRLINNPRFFANLAANMSLVRQDQRAVGINIVGPEDNMDAILNFQDQMKIIDFLWKKYDMPKTSLHAGELSLEYTPNYNLKNHIRTSIDLGHAKRIGHGVSIAYETNSVELLNQMRRDQIAVEICLTSNDYILSISRNKHPILLYLMYGVPIVICVDDPGINRNDLTNEYVRAVQEFGFSYRLIKHFIRNSIEYSFLPGESLFEDQAQFLGYRLKKAFRNIYSENYPLNAEAENILRYSEKARMQLCLEKELQKFEGALTEIPR